MQTDAPATGGAVRWLHRGLFHALGPRQPRVPQVLMLEPRHHPTEDATLGWEHKAPAHPWWDA